MLALPRAKPSTRMTVRQLCPCSSAIVCCQHLPAECPNTRKIQPSPTRACSPSFSMPHVSSLHHSASRVSSLRLSIIPSSTRHTFTRHALLHIRVVVMDLRLCTRGARNANVHVFRGGNRARKDLKCSHVRHFALALSHPPFSPSSCLIL